VYVPTQRQQNPGEQPAADAAAQSIWPKVAKHPEATRGLVLLPKRWTVERSFAWTSRFRRLTRDYKPTRACRRRWP
jgi:transposase